MNLIIDVGNTYVKLAVFKDKGLQEKQIVGTASLIKSVKTILNENPKINRAIISSVGKLKDSDVKKLKSLVDQVLVLDYKTQLPFKNLYKTPKTLGVDRIALVSAAAEQYPNKNILIIDAGTCVTYDFLNDKNEYLGGAISPGLRIRYQSLNNLTANLPLLKAEIPSNIIGNSTENSIHSGVVKGMVKEMDGVIDEYENNYGDLTVILTGGDANFLSKQLKSGIFANSNFLLEGLNLILDYNSN